MKLIGNGDLSIFKKERTIQAIMKTKAFVKTEKSECAELKNFYVLAFFLLASSWGFNISLLKLLTQEKTLRLVYCDGSV